jgi:hypothetical protein
MTLTSKAISDPYFYASPISVEYIKCSHSKNPGVTKQVHYRCGLHYQLRDLDVMIANTPTRSSATAPRRHCLTMRGCSTRFRSLYVPKTARPRNIDRNLALIAEST